VATLRQRRPGVWEIRVFTGRNAAGRPTQISRTVRGTKREAQRVAASLESKPPSNAAGRTVTDVLTAWRDVNQPVWAESTRRDYESRIAKIDDDPIAAMPVARLRVADVERWHARMRKTGVGEAAIRGRHGVLRAALAQALRWEWVGSNPASQAVLRQPKRAPRDAMTPDEVRAAIASAREIDPAAGVALRLAAVAGLRRAELAALQWSDLAGSQLTVDSSACVVRRDGESSVEDVPTKTGDRRVLTLDPVTVDEIAALRATGAGVAVPVLRHGRPGEPRPHRLVVDARTRAVWDRPQVASPRLATLDGHDRDHQWARRPDGRRPPRPRQPGDDAASLRARGRRRGPSVGVDPRGLARRRGLAHA
jgi:integrase